MQRQFKNVLVLCPGRCGSLTLSKALSHLTNWTVGHETRIATVGKERLNYPTQHIEIDNRLAWFLGPIAARFGPETLYVHLWRNPHEIAASFMKRWSTDSSIIQAFGSGIITGPANPGYMTKQALCLQYVETVQTNIDHFLAEEYDGEKVRQSLWMDINQPLCLEQLWNLIGGEGDLDEAKLTYSKHHNAS